MKTIDICALGELLIDFTDSGRSPEGKPLYAANPGGAPPNVLAAAGRLGLTTAFFSRASTDVLGQFLVDTLVSVGIGTEGIVRDPEHSTTLALVSNKPDGDRSFSFYRRGCADAFFGPEDLREDLIAASRVFQLGSLMMSTPSGKEATMKALEIAKRHGVLVSFDPNLRPNIWEDVTQMIPCVRMVLPLCDLLKISEEEAAELTGLQDPEQAAEELARQYPNIKLIFVTLGPDGCFYRTDSFTGRCSSFPVTAVDTTGCGDSFTGGVLTEFLGYSCTPEELTREQVARMARTGCAVGALVATKYGGILSMPTREELSAFLQENA